MKQTISDNQTTVMMIAKGTVNCLLITINSFLILTAIMFCHKHSQCDMETISVEPSIGFQNNFIFESSLRPVKNVEEKKSLFALNRLEELG